ncbi:putative ABC transport system permease protein [Roseovarius litoreus]|uniref:Putative ABC transport system permease protein n=1 Tax=Roseovarius litoreus TaxID=1155722 RepID=A0A1M7FXE4_9RHOB|nr:ABC transporter permease [Roseovarius litoreus]SHM08575.1 putative ABC transport system permease protein [Roseovarius litoreus]
MIAAAGQALWSHWRRNPLQLFTLVAGLALATALWSGVQALNAQARSSYDAAAALLGEGRFDQLVPRSGDTIAQDRFVSLRRAGWLVGPVIEGSLDAGGERVRIVGIDPLTAPGGAGPITQAGDAPLQSFLSERLIFAHPDIAEALARSVTARVVADPGLAPDTAVTDIGVAQSLLNRPQELSRLMLAESQPRGRPPLDEIAPDLVLRPSQQSSDIGQLTGSFHLNLTAFGLLSFAVGIFIVHGAIGLAFEQRRGMVRTLRSLGLPLRHLVGLMAAELAVIALIAGAVGVVLGYLLAAALLPDVAATLEGLYGAQVSGALNLEPSWWLSGLGIALLGTGLAASGAFWRIARMPALANSDARAWSMAAGRRHALLAMAGLGLFGMAVGLVWLGSGLIAGFAGVACLLFGAALVFPLILERALKTAECRARSVRWEWFWADTRQQVPGLSLALMALLLAMAANIGVSTMVSSFRLTFTGFLDQRLTAGLYVATDDADQAEALLSFVDGRAEGVLPLLSAESRLAGQKAEILGVRVGPAYRDNWTFIAQDGAVWDRVATGEAVIINEQMARRADLWPGDRLPLAPGREVLIAGVVSDYGNPIGQAVIGEGLFGELFPETRATRFGLRTQTPDALRDALIDAGIVEEGQITDQSALKAFSMGVFERTFTVTAALNVLTLAVAGFAILMSLLTLAGMRIPQLAPAWALGLTRRELGRLELWRAVILAALTLIVAVPLGLALAWMLLAVINVEAFGWRLPMFLFPLDYAVLGALALCAAMAAAAWPALRLARTPPSQLLKVFAHEG